MTEKPTGDELTPEQIAAQETEQKIKNQDEANKRISKEKDEMKLELEALKAKYEPPTPTGKDGGDEETPDIAEMIRKELGAQKETDTNVAKVMTEFPELKEHETKIRDYLKDDSRKNIPIEEVIAGAIGMKGLMKLGAGMNAERLQTAEESTSGGGEAKIEIKTEEEKQDAKWHSSLPDRYKN